LKNTCHGLRNYPRFADSIITIKSASNNDVISIAGLDQTCYTSSFEALTYDTLKDKAKVQIIGDANGVKACREGFLAGCNA